MNEIMYVLQSNHSTRYFCVGDKSFFICDWSDIAINLNKNEQHKLNNRNSEN